MMEPIQRNFWSMPRPRQQHCWQFAAAAVRPTACCCSCGGHIIEDAVDEDGRHDADSDDGVVLYGRQSAR